MSLMNNPILKIKMTYADMALECVAIILVLFLWIYQVYIQSSGSGYYESSNNSVTSMQLLFIIPINGILLFLLSFVLSSNPQNIPFFFDLSNKTIAQNVYQAYSRLLSLSKINILFYLNSKNYYYSQSALQQKQLSNEMYSLSICFGVQAFLIVIYSTAVIHLRKLAKMKLISLPESLDTQIEDMKGGTTPSNIFPQSVKSTGRNNLQQNVGFSENHTQIKNSSVSSTSQDQQQQQQYQNQEGTNSGDIPNPNDSCQIDEQLEQQQNIIKKTQLSTENEDNN